MRINGWDILEEWALNSLPTDVGSETPQPCLRGEDQQHHNQDSHHRLAARQSICDRKSDHEQDDVPDHKDIESGKQLRNKTRTRCKARKPRTKDRMFCQKHVEDPQYVTDHE